MPWLQLRFDYDTTTIRLVDYNVWHAPASNSTQAKMNMSVFRRSRRSRIAVESYAYRNFDHFCRSRMCRSIVSYRSRVVVESRIVI